jgi:hypothetical protein
MHKSTRRKVHDLPLGDTKAIPILVSLIEVERRLQVAHGAAVVSDIIFDFSVKPRLSSERGNAILVASSIYAPVGSLMLGLWCSWCGGAAPMPKIIGLHAVPLATRLAGQLGHTEMIDHRGQTVNVLPCPRCNSGQGRRGGAMNNRKAAERGWLVKNDVPPRRSWYRYLPTR